MTLANVAYALACIVLPMVWGLIVVWASNKIEAKVVSSDASKRKHGKHPHVSRIEYHI
jgi:hypothetical protein